MLLFEVSTFSSILGEMFLKFSGLEIYEAIFSCCIYLTAPEGILDAVFRHQY